MEGPTAAVAILACLLILALKARHGLGVYLCVVMLYPSYLSIDVGGVNITAGRIVATVLLLRALSDHELMGAFRRKTIDLLVVGLFVWGLVTFLINEGPEILQNRAGVFMDIVFPYFAGRIIVKDRRNWVTLGKWAVAITIAAGSMAVVESVTSYSIYGGMKEYSFVGVAQEATPRWGLTRAVGAVGLHIAFGMCFVAFLPAMLALRMEGGNLGLAGNLGVLCAVAGTFCSLSSGPLLCIVVFGACAALLLRPKLVKPAIATVVLLLVVAEVWSRSHFYYLVGYLTFSSQTAWYRGRLLEVAIEKLPEYWFLGYGDKDPGWGPMIDTRSYVDVCNEYILLAVKHGILATILFICAIGAGIKGLVRAYRASGDRQLRASAWYMGAMVIAFAAAICSVGLLGAAQVLFYLMLGVAAAPYFDEKRIRASEAKAAAAEWAVCSVSQVTK